MPDQFRHLLAFDAGNPHLQMRLAGEQLILTRVKHEPGGGTMELTAPAEDAFALVFQLGDVPEHAISHDGHRFHVAAGPANVITAVDLAGEVTALIDNPFDSLNLRVPRAALDIFADQAGTPRVSRIHLPGQAFSSADPVVARLAPVFVEAIGTKRASPLFADHLLLSLLAHILDRYGDGRKRQARVSGTLAPWQGRRAKAMLDPADGPAPALTEIASACGVSVAHFSRAFKSSVGVLPWLWHQARRVERAQQLLRDATLPLAQVAALAGFADQSHFPRAFSAQIGLSPGKWRRERGVR